MATTVKAHSRSVKGKGNTSVKKHSRISKTTTSGWYLHSSGKRPITVTKEDVLRHGSFEAATKYKKKTAKPKHRKSTTSKMYRIIGTNTYARG